MSPLKILFEGSDPAQAALLERSFLAAWRIIRTKRVKEGSIQENELRAELVRCLQRLAARGFSNGDELTKRCVEELLLGPRSALSR